MQLHYCFFYYNEGNTLEIKLSHIIYLLVNNSMTEFYSLNKPLMLGGLARLTVVAVALQ